MAHIYVEVEENPNSWYLPMQVFELRGDVHTARAIRVDGLAGDGDLQDVVGWSSAAGGSPCEVTYAEVSDSGAAASILVMGGDYGVRMRPAGGQGPWSLEDRAQHGDPYLLLDPATRITPLQSV